MRIDPALFLVFARVGLHHAGVVGLPVVRPVAAHAASRLKAGRAFRLFLALLLLLRALVHALAAGGAFGAGAAAGDAVLGARAADRLVMLSHG